MNGSERAAQPAAKASRGFYRCLLVDEERAIKSYEEIMQCTERDARCVFMFISAPDDQVENPPPEPQTSS